MERCKKRLSEGIEWTSRILFATRMKQSGGSIGTGGCFLDCRYSAEKMISGIEAHHRLASVSTRISIGEERFRLRIDSGKLEFLVKDTIVRTHTHTYTIVHIIGCFIFRHSSLYNETRITLFFCSNSLGKGVVVHINIFLIVIKMINRMINRRTVDATTHVRM